MLNPAPPAGQGRRILAPLLSCIALPLWIHLLQQPSPESFRAEDTYVREAALLLPLAALGTRRNASGAEPARSSLGAMALTDSESLPPTTLNVLGVIAALGGVFWLTASYHRQRLQFSELERSFRALTDREAQSSRMARQLIGLQELDRRRIAQELHDSLGQKLLLIRQNALLAQQAPRPASETLSDIAQSTAAAIDEVRSIAYALRPEELERFGLARAVESLAQDAAHAGGLNLHWSHSGGPARLGSEAEISIFRVLQECLQNVLRHAHAKNIVVETISSPDSFSAVVRDDGVGFHAAQVRGRQDRGWGLPGMTDRMHLLGGSLSVRSAPGAGTEIRVAVPQPSSSLHDRGFVPPTTA